MRIDNKPFRVLLSKAEGTFYASCIWFDGGRVLGSPEHPGMLNFHIEKRHGKTEKEVLKSITDWAKTKFNVEPYLSPVQDED